jgi:hypothetical protein
MYYFVAFTFCSHIIFAADYQSKAVGVETFPVVVGTPGLNARITRHDDIRYAFVHFHCIHLTAKIFHCMLLVASRGTFTLPLLGRQRYRFVCLPPASHQRPRLSSECSSSGDEEPFP